MKKYNILILCAMGMSSGILAKSIKEAGAEKGIELKIECYFCSNFRELDYKETDIILMAPQVRNQTEIVRDYIEERNYNIPVMDIDMMEYGLMNGEAILNKALEKL